MHLDPVRHRHEPRTSAPPREADVARSAPAFFMAGPTKTVIAESDDGAWFDGTLHQPEPWLARVEASLAARHDGASGLVVGALPFGEDAPVHLFHASRSTIRGPWRATTTGRGFGALAAPSIAPPAGHDPAFLEAVTSAVGAIARGEMAKIVLARAMEVSLRKAIHVPTLLRALHARNPHGFTYALDLSRRPRGRSESTPAPTYFVGASPELLLSRRGPTFASVPLAGSVPRSPDPREDHARAAGLLRSAKDRREHAIVVEQIVERLRPVARELRVERVPVVSATARLLHLSTRIEGTLRDRHVSALRLATLLHPTPAVCGAPTARARARIHELEGTDRGYFAGAVGHVDARGDGDWIVAIRCAELSGRRARLFAGAGIVGASQPEHELAETNAKMGTMFDAILSADAGER